MIGIVRIALRRPYTFVVLALVLLIIGPLAAMRTPVDIFPDPGNETQVCRQRTRSCWC